MGWGWDGIGGCRRLGRGRVECVSVQLRTLQHVGEGGGCVRVCECVCVDLDCGGREGVREERDEEGDGTGDPRRTGRWDFDLRLRLHLDLDWAGALGDLDLGVSAGGFARGGRQLCT